MRSTSLLSLGFSLVALAGGRDVGNGGDAIVCRGSQSTSVELADYHEGRGPYRHQLAAIEGTAAQIVEARIGRLAKISPERAKIYSEWAQDFWNSTEFVNGFDLSDIPDTDILLIPRGCELAQIAIHREPDALTPHRYVVNKDLWDLMDENNRAGLVLHEIIFREARLYGHNHSKYARFINSYIAQLRGVSDSDIDFIEALSKANFQEAELLLEVAQGGKVGLPFILKEPFSPVNRLVRIEAFFTPRWKEYYRPKFYSTITEGDVSRFKIQLESGSSVVLSPNQLLGGFLKNNAGSMGLVLSIFGDRFQKTGAIETLFRNPSGSFSETLDVGKVFEYFRYNKFFWPERGLAVDGWFQYDWRSKMSGEIGEEFSLELPGLLRVQAQNGKRSSISNTFQCYLKPGPGGAYRCDGQLYVLDRNLELNLNGMNYRLESKRGGDCPAAPSAESITLDLLWIFDSSQNLVEAQASGENKCFSLKPAN